MRNRRTAACLLIAAGLALAGCDRCLECRCTCDYRQVTVETKIVESRHRFDCGQACEREENCGMGHVVSSECLRTTLVDGRTSTERCARADFPESRR
jgi:hypothetical protein